MIWFLWFKGENLHMNFWGLIWVIWACICKLKLRRVWIQSAKIDLKTKTLFEWIEDRKSFFRARVFMMVQKNLNYVHWMYKITYENNKFLFVKIDVTNSMEKTSIFGSLNWRHNRFLWTFKALWTNMKELHFQTLIPKISKACQKNKIYHWDQHGEQSTRAHQ